MHFLCMKRNKKPISVKNRYRPTGICIRAAGLHSETGTLQQLGLLGKYAINDVSKASERQ